MATDAGPLVKVLVVDDDATFGQFLQRMFAGHDGGERFTFHVEQVADLASARRKLDSGCWSLLLVDQSLPDGRGVDLLHSLVDANDDTPALLMSGDSDLCLQPDEINLFVQERIRFVSKLDLSWETIRGALKGALPEVFRVLVVDDDQDDLEYASMCIADYRAARFEVDTAGNLSQAEQLLRERCYDLILLDYRMEGRRGTELMPLIRSRSPSAHIVLCTYFSGNTMLDEETLSEIAEGHMAYIDKVQMNPATLMSELRAQFAL